MESSLAVLREKEGAHRFKSAFDNFDPNAEGNTDLAFVNASMKEVLIYLP